MNRFTQYLAPGNRHGLNLFAAGEKERLEFLQAAKSAGLTVQHIRTSEMALFNDVNGSVQIFLIEQDLPIHQLEWVASKLVEQIIYPLWFAYKPIYFISHLPPGAYREKRFTPEAVHDAYQAVFNFLLFEQMLGLLTERNPTFLTPASLEQQPDQQPTREAPPVKPATPHDYDTDLDPMQKRAKDTVRGPVRVLAPAGSGKTKTLTNRVIHLLNQGVPSDDILALAFNRKAALEMTQRLQSRGVRNVEIRTFHALGYQILRETLGWRYSGEKEYQRTRQLLAQAVAKQIKIPPRRDSDPLAPFMEMLSYAKSSLPDLTNLRVELEETAVNFEPIFQEFLRSQSQKKHLTFDDMIYLSCRLLLRQDDLRQRYQERFKFLLVDEFQDLNKSQILFLTMLAMPQNNLFVVGDDDQMIYGWRGAEVEHILNFPKRFPTAAETVLSTNYRSTQAIVTHSRRLIDNNKKRVPKNIRARQGAPAGLFKIEFADDLWAQVQAAVKWLQSRVQEHGATWEQSAILYRYRAYQYPLALALSQADIPHTEVDLRELFQTPVGQDVYAYLVAAVEPEKLEPEQTQRILKRPNKFFTNKFIQAIRGWPGLREAQYLHELPAYAYERLTTLVDQLTNIHADLKARPMKTAALLYRLDLDFSLEGYYAEKGGDKRALDEETELIIWETIFALAANFAAPVEFLSFIRETLARKARPPQQNEGLTLSTIHQAKGREYPTVVYFNLSQGAHSEESDEIEEERRVAYVGVTRARQDILITAQRGRPSQFLRELVQDPRFKTYTMGRLIKERNALSNALRRKADKQQQARLQKIESEIAGRRLLDPPRVRRN